jgi:hypothetical protein
VLFRSGLTAVYYLTKLSVSMGDRMISQCAAVRGMRTGRGNPVPEPMEGISCILICVAGTYVETVSNPRKQD